MDNDLKKSHSIDSVFVICLMMLFLLSSLCVIAIGASIYKKNVSLMSDNNSHRIACAYITEKVRQSDINGDIYVDEVFGENALVLTQYVDGTKYNTYIYDYNGHLMELFARANLPTFYPQAGQQILEVQSFDVSDASDNMFSITFVLDDGIEDTLYITKRSSKTD